ncbi:ATP-dependent DNA helicase yku80 [Recurvomyces mirabilis]|nr:ATP-dependent DNA helicase yku80 [Recurvomyces mirabilis]
MASKEATVYIVDLGPSTGETSHGRSKTNLDWSLEYIWDRITATVATGRKTAMAGVLGLRSNATKNILDSDDDYANITVFREIGQVLMPDVRRLRDDLVVSKGNVEGGDAISAIVVAIQMIVNECKKLKYDRKIVLVTDARGPMQTDGLGAIVAKLKEDSIQLVVLGVDFDDAEYGFKEESKDPTKAGNEAVLKQLCEDCEGTFGTLVQAVDELGIPRVKSVKPVPNYRGLLTLGDPTQYDTSLSIDVERYPKTMIAAAPSASKFVVRQGDMGASQATIVEDGEGAPSADGLTAVKNAMTYQIEDSEAPGGKRDVDRDELSKGYEYGRTAVHISESDRNVTMYETIPGFDIIGFVDKNQYDRYLDCHRGNIIIAQRSNERACMALSSFIQSLYELESYAVARIVPKENREPRIVLLAPNIEPDFECLYDIELPFTEDMRSYKFPPLDKVITVSGKELSVHRNLPTDELLDAMSDYVDTMDLSTFGKDDEGHDTEYMAMDETYSPMLHRLHQVINHRAVFPDSEPPPPYEILTRFSHPPAELIEKAQPAIERLKEAANVKKVPPKARGKRYGRGKKDAPKPLSDLDVGALLAQDPKLKRSGQKIDPRNAIPEFRQRIADAASEGTDFDETIGDACKQMQKVILDKIRHSVGSANYEEVVECLRVLREEVNEFEDLSLYHDFLRELKVKLLETEDLGEGRQELWYKIRVNRLGLIVGEGLPGSVSEEEAKKFLLVSR